NSALHPDATAALAVALISSVTPAGSWLALNLAIWGLARATPRHNARPTAVPIPSFMLGFPPICKAFFLTATSLTRIGDCELVRAATIRPCALRSNPPPQFLQ